MPGRIRFPNGIAPLRFPPNIGVRRNRPRKGGDAGPSAIDSKRLTCGGLVNGCQPAAVFVFRGGVGVAAQAAEHRSSVMFDKVRNIGIIAHVDAGKTTTTERILYFGG